MNKFQSSLSHQHVDALVFLCKNRFLKAALSQPVTIGQDNAGTAQPSAIRELKEMSEEELESIMPELLCLDISSDDSSSDV